MTFSLEVKNEILRGIKLGKSCCADAFLYAALMASGSFALSREGLRPAVASENRTFLKLLSDLSQKGFGVPAEFTDSRSGKITLYTAEFSPKLTEYFRLTYRDAEGQTVINPSFDERFFQNKCCKKAAAQALFLSRGAITVPNLSNDSGNVTTRRYHMEFCFSDRSFAAFFLTTLNEEGFAFRETERKGDAVLYAKDSNLIADMLVYLGSPSARLDLENLIIERSLRNDANRAGNCISANIDKSVEASTRQTNAIMKLKAEGVYDALTDKQKKIAEARLAAPEATMEELSAALGISKSGVVHRLEKLMKIAEEIGDKE